jgi:dipeptidyl aminopeptidase/acylaminoacyl peptidase
MNTQEVKTVGCRKAWIAFVAASSCLLIYVMACVMSPPGWSPDSSKIAILVTPPGEQEHPKEFALFVYDIATGAHTLLDEVKADGVLSAPAWSPDGKWIAYYRVEPSPSEQVRPSSEPNAAPSIGERPVNTPEDKPDRSAPDSSAEELFSEENQVLPSFMFELAEEQVKDKNDVETFDVKLVIATPDGKERETLLVMKWVGGDGERQRQSMVLMKPTWSPDCKRLFYVRAIGEGDSFYIVSIDIATGTSYAHLPGSVVAPVVSPDGKWVASYLEDGTLVASGTNGSVCKYFKLDLEPVDGGPPMLDFTFWSPDSKKILVFDKDSVLHGIDIASGQTELYKDPDANSIAYPVISSTDKKLYYLGGFRTGEEGRPPQTISLKRMDLQTKKTRTIFTFRMPELSDDEGRGLFSISPNGKIVLLRGIIKDESGEGKSALIFWDGKTQKIVKTDRWLLKPLYGDSNLIFEEKLIGKWQGEDSRITIAKGTQEKTYKLTLVEEDKEHHGVANLVRLKGMTFLGLFLDESLVEPGSHLLPDMFMRVVQTEPKLRLQAIEYNELAEVLEKAAESIRPEDIGTENIAEFERAK